MGQVWFIVFCVGIFLQFLARFDRQMSIQPDYADLAAVTAFFQVVVELLGGGVMHVIGCSCGVSVVGTPVIPGKIRFSGIGKTVSRDRGVELAETADIFADKYFGGSAFHPIEIVFPQFAV